MTDCRFFVLHSPYPDKTWRGVEKCIASSDGGPMLFFSEEDAAAFAKRNGASEFLSIVPVVLQVPDVRGPLTLSPFKPEPTP